MSSAVVRFIVASSEPEVHQEFDFLLMSGLRVVPADHGEPVAFSAQASRALGDAVGGVAAHGPAGGAAGSRDLRRRRETARAAFAARPPRSSSTGPSGASRPPRPPRGWCG